jgi:hypothetical protein
MMGSKFVARTMALGLILILSCLAGTTLHAGNTSQPLALPPVVLLPPSQAAVDDANSAAEARPALRLLESDEHGMVLELVTPAFQVQQSVADDGPCTRLAVDGYGETEVAGWPALPVRGAMVGIPPQAALTLTVLEADTTVVPRRYDLCPVPRVVIEGDASRSEGYGNMETVRDAAAYAADALYPSSLAELASTGFIRSQRVAELRFHPFQYNPVSGEVQHNRRIRVRLEFAPGESQLPPGTAAVEEGSFEDTLRRTLLNYDAARSWRARPQPLLLQSAVPSQDQPAYKVLVDQDGIYRITPADLLAAGVDVGSIVPRTFQLHNQGQEVALYVTGEGDGSFDDGDSLRFYGQKMNTRYTDTNVYWLTWGAGDGARMAERDGSLSGTAILTDSFNTTFHWEKDLYYESTVPAEVGDHWFGGFVFASGGPASETYDFELHNLATMPYSPTMRGMLFGYSYFSASPDHHTQVYLNGHLIDNAFWDGPQAYEFEHAIPQSYLIEGTNSISVECPLDLPPTVTYDGVYANWFEMDYRDTYVAEDDLLFFDGDAPGTWEFRVGGFTTGTLEVLDITAPLSPTRILSATVEPASSTYTVTFEQAITAEHHYLALAPARRLSPVDLEEDRPSDLHSTANGADYVVITHGDFSADVLPLATHRAGQGLRTLVVDVQDVYDEFSYGIFNPQAIHDFLAYAYANWAPQAPAYVLLVGDGNFDFKDNLGWGEPNYIPPYLADVDPWLGQTAADNRYVCVSGEDIFPDMHLGRLPVKTSAEASALVAKILAYEQNPPGGVWNRQVLFVADDADGTGDYAALSDTIADNYLPAAYTPQKVYYGITHSTATAARTAIVGAINEGRLLVNYVGHAGTQYWAAEKLLRIQDVATLTNAGRLPLMVPMTCLDGYYIWPKPPGQDYSSLGESIVRKQGGGAIASWSPTGYGSPFGHDFLDRGLFEALFFDGVTQLGPATTQAKLYLYSNSGGFRDLLDTYLLFGDPALRLAVRHLVYLPLIQKP